MFQHKIRGLSELNATSTLALQQSASLADAEDALTANVITAIEDSMNYQDFAARPPMRIINAITGLGKNHQLRQILANRDVTQRLPVRDKSGQVKIDKNGNPVVRHSPAVLLVPRLDHASEQAEGLKNALGEGAVFVYRGRLATDETGDDMCALREEVETLYAVGRGAEARNLCRDQSGQACKYADSCPFLRQKAELANAIKEETVKVVVAHHNFLSIDMPSGLIPSVVISDEDPFMGMVKTQDLGLDTLDTARIGDGRKYERRNHLASVVSALFRQGKTFGQIAAHFVHERLDGSIGLARACCVEAANNGPAVRANPANGYVKAGVQKKDRTQPWTEWRFWGLLEEAIATYQSTGECNDTRVHMMTRTSGQTPYKVLRLSWRQEIHETVRRRPFILLDASADERIARRFMASHDIQTQTIMAEQNARIIQVPTSVGADAEFVPYETSDPKRLGRNFWRLVDEVEAAAKRHTKLAVISTKKVRKQLEKQVKSRGISNVVFGHYGAQRGSNKFMRCDGFYIVGRIQPATADIDSIVAALYGDDALPPHLIDPDGSGEMLPRRPGHIHTKDGRIFEKLIPHHPDTRVAAVIEQVREAELIQAFGRARAVRRTDNPVIYVRTSIPLPFPVDMVCHHKNLVGEKSPLAVAMDKTGDVFPLSPKALSVLMNCTEDAARKQLARSDVSPKTVTAFLGFVGAVDESHDQVGDAGLCDKGNLHHGRAEFDRTELNETLYSTLSGLTIAAYRTQGQRGRPSLMLIRPSVRTPEEAAHETLTQLGLEMIDFELLYVPACAATSTAEEPNMLDYDCDDDLPTDDPENDPQDVKDEIEERMAILAVEDGGFDGPEHEEFTRMFVREQILMQRRQADLNSDPRPPWIRMLEDGF